MRTCRGVAAAKTLGTPFVPLLVQRGVPRCRATSPAEPLDLSGTEKATLEGVFGTWASPNSEESTDEQTSPSENVNGWQLSWQINERNLVWNDGLKVALIKRVASDELGISDEEMDWRLEQLAVLLPGLVPRLLRAPPKLVARAAAHTQEIGVRLLRLKAAFPGADCALMVSNRLSLLLDDDMDAVEAAAKRLRELLPGLNVDLFVADFPLVLDIDSFELALKDSKTLLPGMDPVQMLRTNPDMVLSLVKGKHMVPYDQLTNPWA